MEIANFDTLPWFLVFVAFYAMLTCNWTRFQFRLPRARYMPLFRCDFGTYNFEQEFCRRHDWRRPQYQFNECRFYDDYRPGAHFHRDGSAYEVYDGYEPREGSPRPPRRRQSIWDDYGDDQYGYWHGREQPAEIPHRKAPSDEHGYGHVSSHDGPNQGDQESDRYFPPSDSEPESIRSYVRLSPQQVQDLEEIDRRAARNQQGDIRYNCVPHGRSRSPLEDEAGSGDDGIAGVENSSQRHNGGYRSMWRRNWRIPILARLARVLGLRIERKG